jgi:hypothetical protein
MSVGPGNLTRSPGWRGTLGSGGPRRSRRWAPLLAAAMMVPGVVGCDDQPMAPALGETLVLTIEGMDRVPQEMGTLHVWVRGAGGTLHAGTVPPGEGAIPPLDFESPMDRPTGVVVTLERSASAPATPGPSRLMEGEFQGSEARLAIEGAVTDGRPLQEFPGAHSLFTTSNNSEGYPSAENAGLWLFTLIPSANEHGTREVKVTPLLPGWTYEGWVVWQGEPEVWISYGKFRPDEFSLLTSRDDTGTGPFSGAEDFRNAGVEDVPGEEWTTTEIADQLGIELPGGFEVPLALDAVDEGGRPLWHHVITVEPASDLSEGPLEGDPFPLVVYENGIGPGGPGVPRTIQRVSAGPVGRVRPAGI